MSFVEAIKSAYRNYFKFSGRASRPEFWWFYLFNVLVVIATNIIAAIEVSNNGSGTIGFALLIVFGLGTMIPSLALTFRRLHDTERSAWWLLIGLIPFGGIVLLIFYAMRGTPGPNKYGSSPLLKDVASTF